jgi:NADPH:quinone reductase-like Zn-dependent oxidoreductase
MRAIVQDAYGGAEVLHLDRISRPDFKDDDVLIKVEAAGLDRGVWHLMHGLPLLVRIIGYGLRRPKNPVPGSDLAGVVEAVGSNVTRFKPGDEVFGIGKGSFAEYAVAPENKLVHKPENINVEQAAVTAISGLTALQGLRDQAKVVAGNKVLIIGASGGVGSYAVQLAKAMGAEVTAVASRSKLDLVRALGADHVVDYTAEDFADAGPIYDVILDIGGRSSTRRLRSALTADGRLIFVGGEGGGRLLGGIERGLMASLQSLFVAQTLKMFISSENHEDLETLVGYIEAGTVTPSVDQSFPLHAAPDAIRYMEAGQARGKIAITI